MEIQYPVPRVVICGMVTPCLASTYALSATYVTCSVTVVLGVLLHAWALLPIVGIYLG